MSQGAAPQSAAIASMAVRFERPTWVRRINAMAGAVGGDPRRLVPIDAAGLFEAAVEIIGERPTGDFGDPGWQDRFERLVSSVDASSMHVVGRLMSKEELLRSLCTRLRVTALTDRTPAIFDEPIDAPVIITGPARSGTSILFELLWLDNSLRAPIAWEALHPVAFPGAETEPERIALSECEQELWADVQPEFASIHELRSDLPVECVTLTAPSFCGAHWTLAAQLADWAPDFEADYLYHRRVLQLLQFGAPRRNWLLKTPGHLMTLDSLLATYPDAWVVQTHRDPAKTMPSTVSTTAMVQWQRMDDVNLPLLSMAIEAAFSAALNGVAERRKAGDLPNRFIDVHFQRLMRDPVEAIRAAYGAMDRELGKEHAERIQKYLAEKPKGKFGTHRYTAEEWGFDVPTLHEKLAPYIDHFGVDLESKA